MLMETHRQDVSVSGFDEVDEFTVEINSTLFQSAIDRIYPLRPTVPALEPLPSGTPVAARTGPARTNQPASGNLGAVHTSVPQIIKEALGLLFE